MIRTAMPRYLPHLAPPRRLPSLGTGTTLALAALLLVGVYLLRHGDANPVDAEDVLLSLPLAVLALKFGIRGGIIGAVLALGLIGVWDAQDRDAGIELEGYLSWGLSFLLLGGLLGFFVEHRQKLERAITRYFDGSLDLLGTANLEGRFTRVNPAWERVLGHSVETICSRPILISFTPTIVRRRGRTRENAGATSDGG
jgi:PAS domain-containing protein